MSKSRLEKFLYALYSLDSSDLPNPLSRIEELYKCLVTGDEAPTFEPLSRVEKYLMAILGVYDADELPNPISRVEVLLYKLATGDDNLDDVKSFLSEHEELLAEIIRNGGVGGNIDTEYVLYTLSTEFNTLYNTAKKPVKSAILTGQTLVNLINGGEVTKNATNNWVVFSADFNADMIKTSTDYTLITYVISNTLSDGSGCDFGVSGGLNNGFDFKAITVPSGKVGVYKIKLTTKNVFSQPPVLRQQIFNDVATGSITFKQVLVEGDYTNVDVPYFEGMQSVKMPVLTTTGKNLIDIRKFVDGFLPDNSPYDTAIPDNFDKTSDYTRVEPNTTYCYSVDTPFDGLQYLRWYFYKEIGVVSDEIPVRKLASGVSKTTFTTPTDCNYIRICSRGLMLNGATVQLEKSPTPTPYEPFKSNILTVNEDVTLRGIGDVHDELNVVTGELTQRIGEIVLDGTQSSVNYSSEFSNNDYYCFIYDITKNGYEKATLTPIGISYYIPFQQNKMFPWTTAKEFALIDSSGNTLVVKLLKSRLSNDNSISTLNTYLASHPITINYPLMVESIKTVDLSVVDQDGNNTKLSTFDDITHVTLSSEGLIPEAELEVATKNEEDLEDSVVYAVHTLSEELNTLYNTAEKPVKSAFLKGQTLVNLTKNSNIYFKLSATDTWNDVPTTAAENRCCLSVKNIEPNTKYIIKILSRTTQLYVRFFNSTGGICNGNSGWINSNTTFTTRSDTTRIYITLRISENNEDYSNISECANIILLKYQEGMENWDIPYFEGMQSVKMPVLMTTGKQLLNVNDLSNIITTDGTIPTLPTIINAEEGIIQINETSRENYKGYKVKVKPNTDYIGSCFSLSEQHIRCRILDLQGNKLNSQVDHNPRIVYSFNSGDNDYVVVAFTRHTTNKEEVQIALYEGTTQPTSYEPYKSNILTVNEEVTLCGIGKVKDEIDLLTGDVTQRICEIVLDGSEDWKKLDAYSNDYRTFFVTPRKEIPRGVIIVCGDYLPTTMEKDADKCGYIFISSNNLNVVEEPNMSLDTFKNKLKSKPIKFQYKLETESIKTVDLSVVNQDGNNTELSTFNDITHVTLSSEGLIPEAELEVAEKVTEVAISMLSISRDQEVIDTTTNKQSEDVDATMIATTEIYEELL